MYPYVSCKQITVGCIFVRWTPPSKASLRGFLKYLFLDYFRMFHLITADANGSHLIDDTCIIFYSMKHFNISRYILLIGQIPFQNMFSFSRIYVTCTDALQDCVIVYQNVSFTKLKCAISALSQP